MNKTISCFVTAILLLTAAALAKFTLLSTDRPGRTFAAPHEGARFVHWDIREFPDCRIPYSFHDGPDTILVGNDTIVGGTLAFDQVDFAFLTWQFVPANVVVEFERVLPAAPAMPAGNRDNNNMIGWRMFVPGEADESGGEIPEYPPIPNDTLPNDEDSPDYPSESGGIQELGTLAFTRLWYELPNPVFSNGRILEADIVFNKAYRWVNGPHDLGATPPQADIQSVATHECGHFIGLSHETATNPGPGPNPNIVDGHCPTMWALADRFDGSTFERTIEQNDQEGARFLYTPDLGDMRETVFGPPFRTLIHTGPQIGINGDTLKLNGRPRFERDNNGAIHLFGAFPSFHYETLGPGIDAECDPDTVDQDGMDDGLILGVPFVKGQATPITVTVCARRDPYAAFHRYNAATPLFLNIWIDWSQDGNLGPGDENVVSGVVVPPGLPPFCQAYPVLIPVPPEGAMLGDTWLRARLDWGEDAGARRDIDGTLENPFAPLLGEPSAYGAAQHGEVEDYKIHIRLSALSDLGDLDTCRYPTFPNDPSHALSHYVWLGDTITGEANPNMTNQDGGDDGVQCLNTPWTPGDSVDIRVVVKSAPGYESLEVYFNFWKDGNNDRDFCDTYGSLNGTALEWAIQNRRVTAAGSPYVFRLLDPGPLSGGPYDLIARARLTSGMVTRENSPYITCDMPCYFSPSSDTLGEVEDYILDDQQLSVSLIGFTAIPGNESVMLQWSTASELENDRFEVRRDNALVASIPGHGTTSSHSYYQWMDIGLVNGVTYHYTLTSVSMNSEREVVAATSATPVSSEVVVIEYALYQNFPNPFNPTTSISFDLVESSQVTLRVFDVTGRIVSAIVGGQLAAGRHTFTFDAGGLPSGLYFYELRAGIYAKTNKMLLMR